MEGKRMEGRKEKEITEEWREGRKEAVWLE